MQSIQIFYVGPVISAVTYFERNFVDYRKTERILIWTLSVIFLFFKTKLDPNRATLSWIGAQTLLLIQVLIIVILHESFLSLGNGKVT